MKKYVKSVLDKLGSRISKLLDSMLDNGIENSSVAASLVFNRAKEYVKWYEHGVFASDMEFAEFVEGLIEQDSLTACLDFYYKYREENAYKGVDKEFLGLWLNFRFAEVRDIVNDFAKFLSEESPYLENPDSIVENLTSFIYTLIAEEDFFSGDVKNALFDRFVDSIMGSEKYGDLSYIEEDGFDMEGYTDEQLRCVDILLCSDAMADIFKGVPKYHKILIDCWKEVFKHSSLDFYSLC